MSLLRQMRSRVATRNNFSLSFRRCYIPISEPRKDEVQVPVGASGSITLEIYNGQDHESRDPSSLKGPLILYLSTKNCPLPRALLTPSSTLVRITPRMSRDYLFPIALHDTLAAYDWAIQNLCPPEPQSPSPTSLFSSSRRLRDAASLNQTSAEKAPRRQIAVYSTSTYSSLALSLSLTESTLANPHRITAIASLNGIYDHSILASTTLPSSADSALTSYFATKSHFRNPSATFDPFISPVYWFRTPGIRIPATWPGEDIPPAAGEEGMRKDEEEMIMPVFDDLGNEVIAWDSEGYGRRINVANEEVIDLSPLPPRKSYLTFQSKGSDIILPFTRFAISSSPSSSASPSTTSSITTSPLLSPTLSSSENNNTTKESSNTQKPKKSRSKRSNEIQDFLVTGNYTDLLTAQALEMRRLMRRSITLHEGKEKGGVCDADAEERVKLFNLNGDGSKTGVGNVDGNGSGTIDGDGNGGGSVNVSGSGSGETREDVNVNGSGSKEEEKDGVWAAEFFREVIEF